MAGGAGRIELSHNRFFLCLVCDHLRDAFTHNSFT